MLTSFWCSPGPGLSKLGFLFLIIMVILELIPTLQGKSFVLCFLIFLKECSGEKEIKNKQEIN